jgi:hypothetical protein
MQSLFKKASPPPFGPVPGVCGPERTETPDVIPGSGVDVRFSVIGCQIKALQDSLQDVRDRLGFPPPPDSPSEALLEVGRLLAKAKIPKKSARLRRTKNHNDKRRKALKYVRQN